MTDVLLDYDATNLYLSAKWDEKAIYPKTEMAYVFTPNMIDQIVEKCNAQTNTQSGAVLGVF